MKKLLLSLIALIALTTPAFATDVTIAALTVDGFSPSAIGNDRLIAVSTAGGSPTVTSSGLFTSIVGLSGFRVLIDGTQYTVASVASTSSLTLTTNYSGTPGAQVMTLYKWVEMRVYADRAFQPLGGSQIVQPGTVGSGSFFRRFAASIVNNGATDQLFIPQIVIPATTDALITNQARYSFPMFRPGGSQIQFFFCPSSLAELRLPPATPTTWTAICQFNSASAVIPPNNQAYTKTEIDNRFPSCTLNNGVYYSASGNILSCLTFGSGLTVTGNTLTASAGGSGYATIQEEGTPLAQRATLNFIGTAFTAADEGPTRTNLSADPDLNALASITGTGFSARTAADTWLLRSLTQPAAGLTIANPAGVAGNPTFALANDLAALEGLSSTGGAYRTGSDTWANRTLTQPAAGLTITNPAGIAGNPTFVLANDLAALEGLAGTGFSTRTASDAWATRTLTQPAAGFTITNPAGIAGNPTFTLANDLNAVEGLSTSGIATRTASDTWTTRTITGTANRIGVTNGDGVAGNPTLDIGSDVVTLTGSQTLTNKTVKGYSLTLEVNTATVGNVGAGLDSLHSFNLVAGSLAADGDRVRFTLSGTFASNDNDKRIRISIDNQTMEDFGLFDFDSGTWRVTGEFVRVSSTTVLATCFGIYGEALVMDEGVVTGTPDVIHLSRNILLTVANLNSNAVIILAQAEATANNDVTQNLSIIELVQR